MSLFSHQPAGIESTALSGGQMLELATARRACAKVTGAVRMAAMSGWTIAIFAGITLIAGISTLNSTWMGLMMTMAAFVEFRGQGRLRRLEPSAAKTLGYNQLVLGLLIVLYAAWNVNELTTAWPGTIKFDFSLQGESLQFALGHAAFRQQVSLLLYAVMGILAVIIQGTAAWYCFSRDHWIRQYVSFAPSWIVQMQRAGIAL